MTLLEAKRIARKAGYALREKAESKTLDDFIENHGGIDHVGVYSQDGERGRQGHVVVMNEGTSLSGGLTIYPFTEHTMPSGETFFSAQSGWGLKKGQVKAVLDLLEKVDVEDISSSDYE